MSKTSGVSRSLFFYRSSGPLREAESGQRVDEDGGMPETAARHALTTILRPAECRSPAAMREHVADLKALGLETGRPLLSESTICRVRLYNFGQSTSCKPPTTRSMRSETRWPR